MTTPHATEDDQWKTMESVLIAEYAYRRFIMVEPWDVQAHIVIWRQWYYGMIPWNAVLSLPNVRHLGISGR